MNELLLAFIVASLLSFRGNIRGHLSDDSNTLGLDLLEALHQLKRLLTFLSQSRVKKHTAESL